MKPLSLAAVLCTIAFPFRAAQVSAAEAAPPVNYTDHIAPLLKEHCGKCHGETIHKAGLDFSNYPAALKGGSGGPVVVAGRPTRSRLLDLVTSDEPAERMPQGGEPLTAEQVALLKTWIAEGLREKADSASLLPAIVPLAPAAVPPADSPEQPAAAFDPTRLPPPERRRLGPPFPTLALAPHPEGRHVAQGSYESIDMVDGTNGRRTAVYFFPEGEAHVLRFNRTGTRLLAAGGRPADQGVAVLIETATAKRLATIDGGSDTVLAADLAPDENSAALGGTDRLVKLVSLPDGKPLRELVKHTDWVTALAFSPDGKLLATGDRVGNIYLWDPQTGRIVLALADHKGSIRKLAWRTDGKVLASCGEDGLIVWWDVEKGAPMTSKADAHTRPRAPGEFGPIAGGVLDVDFGPQGELVSCGRDGAICIWSIAGEQLHRFVSKPAAKQTPGTPPALPLRATFINQGRTAIAGDSIGNIQIWNRAP